MSDMNFSGVDFSFAIPDYLKDDAAGNTRTVFDSEGNIVDNPAYNATGTPTPDDDTKPDQFGRPVGHPRFGQPLGEGDEAFGWVKPGGGDPDTKPDQFGRPVGHPRFGQPLGEGDEAFGWVDPNTRGGDEGDRAAVFAPRADARNSIKAVLDTYGLGELADYLYDKYTSGLVGLDNPDALLFSIRDTPTYKKRFAANATRLKAGLSELSPGNYIGLENFYRQTMQTNGLPPDTLRYPDDFTNLIANDISAQEFNDRIVDGYRAVADADPEVKRQMTELYGVTESQLAAYFIDPTRTAPILALQAKAAKIGARGKELAGIQVTGSLAEDLARRGITEQQAQAGFTEFAGLGELTADLAGEEATTQSEEIGASFGFDTAAADRLKKKRGRRVGEFQGGGTFTRTRGETSGGTTLAVGTAQ